MNSRRVLITGATSGIGLQTALQLGAQGDHIILAARRTEQGEALADQIRQNGGSAEFRKLDLGDLEMIRDFAAAESAAGKALDVLINNAGALPPKERSLTKDGFEMDFGVGFLGHFALTGLLLANLEKSAAPRVISVSSVSHKFGYIHLDDLHHEHHYTSSMAYNCTKLACLMFAVELQRRVNAAGSHLLSVAAHPGISKTPIASGWEKEGRSKLWDRLELLGYHIILDRIGRSAAEGAQSIVYAASNASIVGGGYYGPTGFLQYAGAPGRVKPSHTAMDVKLAAGLWQAAEELTGIRYRFADNSCSNSEKPQRIPSEVC